MKTILSLLIALVAFAALPASQAKADLTSIPGMTAIATKSAGETTVAHRGYRYRHRGHYHHRPHWHHHRGYHRGHYHRYNRYHYYRPYRYHRGYYNRGHYYRSRPGITIRF
jgi:hypothetical protein